MKKLIAVILSLALFCLLIPAVAEEASVTGTWYIAGVVGGDEDIQVVDPNGITIEIKEDGSFVMAAGGASASGSWKLGESAVILTPPDNDDADPIELTVEGEELILDMNGTIVRLSKTPVETPEAPKAVAAESADAFDGLWLPAAQLTYGLYGEMSEEMIAAYGRIKPEGGKISFLIPDEKGELAEYSSYEASLEDGKLTFTEESGIPFTAVLTLLDDGRLLYETIMTGEGGQSITLGFIYVREAAAEEPAA